MKDVPVKFKRSAFSPALRFGEFLDHWELIRLGDFVEQYIERVPFNTNIPILTSSRNGLFRQRDYFANRELINKGEYGVVPRGYFTYRHMSDDSTFKFNINEICDRGAVSKEYPVFQTVNMNPIFLYHKLNYGNELKQFAIAQKLGGTRVRLYFKNLKSLQFLSPSYPEQQKIAEFLTSVDLKIQQLNEKKALLEKYKKGVMQQIFNQKIRFRDEDGNDYPRWEEKKLGDVCEINPKSQTLPSDFIYIDLESVVNGSLITENRILLKNAPSRAQRVVRCRDILFQMVRPYQRNNLYFEKEGDYVASTGYAQIRTDYCSRYIYHQLNEANFQSDVMNRCTGTSYPAINSSALADIDIWFPSLPEQEKIANFLSFIDQKLELVSRQLNKTQEFKKGLLQQMFV